MPRGKPAKSAEQHRAEGTYRADRHAALEGPPPAPAVDLSAPQAVVDLELVPTWDIVVADLSAIGTLCNTDLIRLTDAMQQRANFVTWQARLESLLDDPEASESDRTKAQSNINSSLASFNSIIDGVEKSVRLRPKPKAADYLARI